MTSTSVGLIRKYEVSRVDGKAVEWCFVLEYRDPLIGPALVAYAAMAYEAGYARLHRDLVKKIHDLAERPEALKMTDICDRCEHPRGTHFITFDAQVLGCFERDEETEEGVEMCQCYGFIPRPEAA
jgi:hypothetical protein